MSYMNRLGYKDCIDDKHSKYYYLVNLLELLEIYSSTTIRLSAQFCRSGCKMSDLMFQTTVLSLSRLADDDKVQVVVASVETGKTAHSNHVGKQVQLPSAQTQTVTSEQTLTAEQTVTAEK